MSDDDTLKVAHEDIRVMIHTNVYLDISLLHYYFIIELTLAKLATLVMRYHSNNCLALSAYHYQLIMSTMAYYNGLL